MDGSQSGCSSEQSASQQPQQGEKEDLIASQKNEADTEVVVQSDSQVVDKRYSMKMSDSDNHNTSLDGSSPKVDENGSGVCGVDMVVEDRGKQCEDSSVSGVNDSQSWCDPSMLLDNSVEEFSLISERNKGNAVIKENFKQTLDEVTSSGENILESAHEESESPTLSRESEDDGEFGPTEQEKVKPESSVSAGTDSQANSCHLQSDIKSILAATSPLCSPNSDLEVGRVDFSTTPKENLMRMVCDLLDECDWLKKEKAR